MVNVQCEMLACVIHEYFGFVNKHPQQLENHCCGFRQGASHPSFDKLRIPSIAEGLKANPERKPAKVAVEGPGRIIREICATP
jgi:hypothetical protein